MDPRTEPEELASIDIEAAADRLRGAVLRTPLVPFQPEGVELGPIDLRLKLECLQETASFKARGAWNQLSQLSPAERAAGVVTTSSGNHGRAVAWAARRADVAATIFMPKETYPNKIAACRDEGADVVLKDTRLEAEEACAARVSAGATLIHPYAQMRTIEGAGTVGLEVAEQWPEVEFLFVPVGGAGLISGSAIAMARKLGDEVAVVGVEPEGSATLTRALESGMPVTIDPAQTTVQGLCPLSTGEVNVAIAQRYVEATVTLSDDEIYRGQEILVKAGMIVEPAGAAAFAAVLAGALPIEFLERRSADDPLRVACIVTGGNPDPEQIEGLRG